MRAARTAPQPLARSRDPRRGRGGRGRTWSSISPRPGRSTWTTRGRSRPGERDRHDVARPSHARRGHRRRSSLRTTTRRGSCRRRFSSWCEPSSRRGRERRRLLDLDRRGPGLTLLAVAVRSAPFRTLAYDWGAYQAGLRFALERVRAAIGRARERQRVRHPGSARPFPRPDSTRSAADSRVRPTAPSSPLTCSRTSLRLGPAALLGPAREELLTTYVPLAEKELVIHMYELGFSRRAREHGSAARRRPSGRASSRRPRVERAAPRPESVLRRIAGRHSGHADAAPLEAPARGRLPVREAPAAPGRDGPARRARRARARAGARARAEEDIAAPGAPASVSRCGSGRASARHAEPVERRQLLALLARARGVRDRHLVDALARAQHARRDLRLDREAPLAQAERAEELGAHRLVAGHDVRDPAVVDHVRRERDALVAHHVPEAERGVARPGPRAEDDARVAVEERLQQRREVGGAVLEVGVEDRGELAGRVLEPGLERRSLAAVPLVEDERTFSGHAGSRSSSRVPSVDPSSTITSWRDSTGKLRRERVVDRPLDGRELVEDGHQDREGVAMRGTLPWRQRASGT